MRGRRRENKRTNNSCLTQQPCQQGKKLLWQWQVTVTNESDWWLMADKLVTNELTCDPQYQSSVPQVSYFLGSRGSVHLRLKEKKKEEKGSEYDDDE